MDEAEYKTFVQSAYDGHLLVGVDRVFARKLYTDVPLSAIEEATGEAPYFDKFVVWFAFLVSPVAAVACFILAGFAFQWWALLIVPIAFLWWMFNRSMSVRGGSTIWLLTLLFAATIVAHLMNLLPNPWMSGFFAVFLLALWCDRLLYCASTTFLRAFVLRNQRAFEAFGDALTIREVARGG